MSLDPVTAGIDLIHDIGGQLITHFFPDPAQAAAATMQLETMRQNGELAQLAANTDLLKGQLQINTAEAANPNVFVSGWRPFIGWVSGIALFSYYVPYCLTATAIWAYQCIITHSLASRPDLGITDLIGLVGTMLGMSTLRSVDKFNGVASK